MTADKRRVAACLKACEGISTQNLEDNVPVLELARRYNVVLRERDALRAKVEAMERHAPSIKDDIIDDLQSQFDTEGITEHDSGGALIRLSDAIAAVEDNFAQPAPESKS